jgi:hypothetical protein
MHAAAAIALASWAAIARLRRWLDLLAAVIGNNNKRLVMFSL